MSAPHPRLLRHPGPVAPERSVAAAGAPRTTARLVLAPGRSLQAGLLAELDRLAAQSAAITLLAGRWARLTYCTAVPDPSGLRLATYTGACELADALLLGGNATVGRGGDGAALVHCHAAFVAADGRALGGHLVPDRCLVGDRPVHAFATLFSGFEIAQTFDPETNHNLFRPVPAAAGAAGRRPVPQRWEGRRA